MIWFGKDTLPRAVESARLPEHTVIHGRYVIEEIRFVSGLELVYLAHDASLHRDVYLSELLPMGWAAQDEQGEWVPYHSGARDVLAAVKGAYTARFSQLKMMEESALLPVIDTFEEMGTVWSVSDIQPDKFLSDEMEETLYSPGQAVELLSPVLDTLAGLHELGFIHGGITAHAIRLGGDAVVVLGDFGACFAEGMPILTPESDVTAVSRLLYAMMTGETQYDPRTARRLPASVRRTLASGMAGEIGSIVSLWRGLHGDAPARRAKSAVPKASPLSRFMNVPAALIFCGLCLFTTLAVWVFAGGTSAVFPSVPYTAQQGSIVVPEIMGFTAEDAITRGEDLGLFVVIDGHEANPTVPEGCVTRQFPFSGGVLEKDGIIHITLSSGWESYVPDVRNFMLEDALALLEGLGFKVEYTEVESASNVPGSVISQDIKPDEKLPMGSVIHLEVSLGRVDVDKTRLETVGNYVGVDFESAKKSLAALHLYAFQAKTVYSKDVPAGVIIAQQVPEGKRVAQGTVINMVVSLGEEMTRVADVRMLNAASARSQLEAAGLKAVMCYVSDSAHGMDYVLSQSVPAGTMVPVGSEIWLNVSIGRASYVESTGGWSGNPLPTAEASETETSAEETIPPTEEGGEFSPPTEEPTEYFETETEPETPAVEETVPEDPDPDETMEDSEEE